MKISLFTGFLSLLILILSCSGAKKDIVGRRDVNDTIPYIPLVTLGDLPFYIGVEVFFNDSVSGNFFLDTGGPAGLLNIDSAFFFDNVDTSCVRKVFEEKTSSYWIGRYEGDIRMSVGDHSFQVNKVSVWNHKHSNAEGYPYIGLIGEDLLLNKYTVLDIDDKRIAFVDTLTIDSSYMAVPMHSYKEDKVPDRKYIEISGFENNEGNRKTGRFIFDTGCSPLSIFLKPSFAEDIVMTDTWTNQSRLFQNMDSIQIGKIYVNDVTVGKTVNPPEIERFKRSMLIGDGLLGMPFILRFNMILDYKHNMLYLKPSKYYDADIAKYLR